MRPIAPTALLLAAALAVACSDSGQAAMDVPPTPPPDDVAELDATDPPDATEPDAAAPDASEPDAPAPDAGPAVGPTGGAVERFRFAVYGDVRPPREDETARYPTMIIEDVMAGIAEVGAQFVVATGDYMFASSAQVAERQVAMLLAAERRFAGYVFHALGNHECTGATASNCPNATETGNMRVYRERLTPAHAGPYFDWVVRTSMGDAHFIATAPNAWSSSQEAWLGRAMAQPARYTFVIAHEPPTSDDGPGSVAIENAIRARPGGVTLRLYGHTHDYRRIATNAVISGNGGAPLSGTGGTYGFVAVEQRADGNVVVTAYDVGHPPMVADTFVLRPDGSAAR